MRNDQQDAKGGRQIEARVAPNVAIFGDRERGNGAADEEQTGGVFGQHRGGRPGAECQPVADGISAFGAQEMVDDRQPYRHLQDVGVERIGKRRQLEIDAGGVEEGEERGALTIDDQA